MKLIAGDLCLDFANTAGRRSASGVEVVSSYDDLVRFMRHAHLLTEEEAERLHRLAAQDPERAEGEFERALDLREAIYGVFSAVAAQKTPPRGALARVNAAASEMLTHLTIEPRGTRFEWTWHNVRNALEFPRLVVARAAARLLVADEIDRVRECQARDCHWLFVDLTCNASRRWCDMATCGNREKVRQYRARQRTGNPSAPAE